MDDGNKGSRVARNSHRFKLNRSKSKIDVAVSKALTGSRGLTAKVRTAWVPATLEPLESRTLFSTNLVQNPGFEASPSSTPNWTFVGSASQVGLDTDGSASHSGNNEAYTYNLGNSGYGVWTQTVNVSPNTDYSLSAYLQDSGFSSGGVIMAQTTGGSTLTTKSYGSLPSYTQVTPDTFNSGANTQVVISIGYTTSAATTTWLHVDDASLTAVSTNSAPTIATAAAASPTPVTGTTTAMSVLGADDGGESDLTYTWATTGTPPAAVTFSANNTNAAKSATATFTKAGTYNFQVTISDGSLSTTSSVAVTVNQTLSSIAVTPGTQTLNESQTQSFSAIAKDQFGNALTTQPTFTWSVPTGGGSVNSSGLYTAPGSTGSATVEATAGSVNGTSAVTISNAAPTVATAAAASPTPATGTTTALSVLGADDGGESHLTYTWATTGTPPAAVTFSANGTNAAKSATATFTKAGTYNFQVTISDGNLSTTSSVAVTVNQTLTSIAVTPVEPAVTEGATEAFSAIAYDQFETPLDTQPTFTWSIVSGDGSIDSNGLYSATSSAGSVTVQAASASVSGSTTATVGPLALPFADDFTREDAGDLGSQWTTLSGSFSVASNAALAHNDWDGVSLATVTGSNATNVDLSANIDISATQDADAAIGLAARVSGDTYYVAEYTRRNSEVEILKYIDGVRQYITSARMSGSPQTGELIFEVNGSSLRAYFNGILAVSTNDTSITGAGGFGLHAIDDYATADNFSATVLPTPLNATLPFSDSFDGADQPDLSAYWTEQQNGFGISGNQAVAEGEIGNSEAESFATLNGITAADLSISASVDISRTAAHGAIGLAARVSEDGNTYYLARLVTEYHTRSTLEIDKCVDGVLTTLATTDLYEAPQSGSLRFELLGSTLKIYFNEKLYLTTTDSDISAAGAIGLYALDTGATADNFTAVADTVPSPEDATLPFSDSFDGPGTSILGANWTKEEGDATISAQAVVPAGDSASAMLNGVSEADVDLSADVNITTTQYASAGLDARIDGDNAYRGQIAFYSGSDHAEILLNNGGTWTTLDSRAIGGGSGALRFEVVGDSLELLLNGRPVAQAVDDTLSGPGTVGFYVYQAEASLDNFSAAAAPVAPSPLTVSLPFADTFDRANSTSLGASWTTTYGIIAVGSDAALSLAGSSSSATLNGLDVADASVSATVSVSTEDGGSTAGFDARVSGTSAYRGQLRQSGSGAYAEILVEVDGDWTTLDSRYVPLTNGTLRFDLAGDRLGLYLNDQLVASARDSRVASGGNRRPLFARGSEFRQCCRK